MKLHAFLAFVMASLATGTSLAQTATLQPTGDAAQSVAAEKKTRKMTAAARFLLEKRGIAIGDQSDPSSSGELTPMGFGCELTDESDIPCGGGWIDNSWSGYGGGGYFEVSVAQLPRVTVEGQRFGPQEIVICIDTCQTSYGLEYVDPGPIISVAGSSIWQSILDWLLPTPRISACGPATAGVEVARNGTSWDDDEQRDVTANAILNFSIPVTHRIGMTGKTVQVMYSDGGTELYIYSGGSSKHRRKAQNELTRGTGSSKCPV